MHVHRIAEVSDDPFRAQSASFFLVGVAALAMQHLFVRHCHGPAANPVATVAGVYMVEVGQLESPRMDNSIGNGVALHAFVE
jgi:hypothetical protein